MNALILKAALVLTLLFGAAGGTAVMAQESLPDSPMYAVKLALEDARLAVNQDTADEAVLHFSFAEERAQEMVAMVAEGNLPDTAVQERLETHLNAALNLSAQQPDEAMGQLLAQAQNMIQAQIKNIAGAEAGADEAGQKMLGEAVSFLNRAGQEIEDGLKTPQIFRVRYGNIPEGTVPQENGPCNTDDCEPVGDENKFGQDPENEGQNGPGDGTCDGEDCEPAGDQNQFGQDPENEGQNGPGEGECIGEDCNQYRYQYGLDDLPLEPPHFQYQNLTGSGDGECNNGDCIPGGGDVNHGDGNNGDGNNGDGNNGDGNNGGGEGDGNNGDGNNGDGNNGGSGGNGGGGGGGNGGG